MSSVTTAPAAETTTSAPPSSTTASPGTSGGSRASVQLKASLSGKALDVQLHALAPVQRKDGEDTGAVHQAAAQGIASGGGAMPHADKIQASFGAHDVSSVQAHTGSAASAASSAMGAQAYATGNHVVFGGAPDLHTAAHEAAHVVQQRAGVSLSGGVGQSGDAYEQHADKVADAVVSGRSAEGLLTQMSGGGAAEGVQRRVQRVANDNVQRAATPVAPMAGAGANFNGATPNTIPTAGAGGAVPTTGGGSGTGLPSAGGTAGLDPSANPATAATAPTPPTVDQLKALVHGRDHSRYQAFEAKAVALGLSAAQAESIWDRVIQGLIAAEGAQLCAGLDTRNAGWEDRARAMIAAREPASAAYFRPVVDELIAGGKFNQYLGGAYALWGGGNGAKEYAASKGFTILETTAAGQLFDGLKIMDGSQWNIFGTLWAELSSAFARHCAAAGGQIHGFFRWFGDTYAAFEEPQVRGAMATGRVQMIYRPLEALTDGAKGSDLREVGAPCRDKASWQAAKSAWTDKKTALTAAGKWRPNPAAWPDPLPASALDALNP